MVRIKMHHNKNLVQQENEFQSGDTNKYVHSSEGITQAT